MDNDTKNAKLVFQEWKAKLAGMDRSISSVSDNFDELFFGMYNQGVKYDAAHTHLKDAISAHMFSQSQAKWTYKNSKMSAKGKTFKEFVEDWQKLIDDLACQSFFQFYSLKDNDEKEEERFGGVSPREYAAQRRYAESFGKLDWKKVLREQEAILNEEYTELEVSDDDQKPS